MSILVNCKYLIEYKYYTKADKSEYDYDRISIIDKFAIPTPEFVKELQTSVQKLTNRPIEQVTIHEINVL